MQSIDITDKPLNQGQQAAADGFFTALMDDTITELKITGPGGVGKTFLITYLIDKVMPKYFETCGLLGIKPKYMDCVITATTNQAAEVLHEATRRDTSTIQSFMNLLVREDFKSGRTYLQRSKRWKVHSNLILIVDEAFTIDSDLRKMIQEGTIDCKIIWVGDHCQLGPIMERISPIHLDESLQTFHLTEPMRNADQPALMELCTQLRNTVETGIFQPIKLVPGVIDLLSPELMEREIESEFAEIMHSNKIVGYTNERVIDYNNFVREIRNLPPEPTEGELLVNNAPVLIGDNHRLGVQQEVTVVHVEPDTRTVSVAPGISFSAYQIDVATKDNLVVSGLLMPCNWDNFTRILKHFADRKDWFTYYTLKERHPDLRPRDASTVHKVQGSTCETIYIDAENLSTCRDPVVASRLLYVAVSRARRRIVFYGPLADKYGGYINA